MNLRIHRRRLTRCLGTLLAPIAIAAFGSAPASAEVVRVAVASNFAKPAAALFAEFTRATGHRAVVSTGSTGKLYAQIVNGAPFDVLLSADAETPQRLLDEGLAVSGSRLTYAVGRLVLWSATPGLVGDGAQVLRTTSYRKLAVANPQLAPYGRAALEALGALGLQAEVEARLVTGENIAQAHQFVATGNAELGFVALAQVMEGGRLTGGSGWVVPKTLHRPIRQDAVILKRGDGNAAAAALIAFLGGERARAIIGGFGYDLRP